MNFFNGIINGFREAWAHKFRSFLSMIGIVLGVASLVAMMGVAEGLIRDFRTFFEESGGVERVSVYNAEAPEWQRTRAYLSPGRTLTDAKAIRELAPLAQFVSPQVDAHWKQLRAGEERSWAPVQGVTPGYQGVFDTEMEQGRFIAEMDVEGVESVVVLGWIAYERLFRARGNVVGKRITIEGHAFKIIGVEKEFVILRDGRNIMRWKNRDVYIPITTAQRLFKEPDKIDRLDVKVADASKLNDLVTQIQNILLATHRGIHDIRIETREDELAELEQKESGFTYSLGTLAIISLLVGGIGITNVMLASINERVREIGVRKAIGARSTDIFTQFVAESVSISLLGGLLGLAASYGLVSLVESIMPKDTVTIVLTTKAFVIGFTFSVATGIISGIYPAIKAARLDPITALRYE